jgi:hypothetical protein
LLNLLFGPSPQAHPYFTPPALTLCRKFEISHREGQIGTTSVALKLRKNQNGRTGNDNRKQESEKGKKLEAQTPLKFGSNHSSQ